METVRLGRTELQVTPIAYGTWQFGGEWGEVEERSAIESIRHARVDTSPYAAKHDGAPAPEGA
jgi:aryl-alcohol dehydrogenase-like predicted oxidoreductase